MDKVIWKMEIGGGCATKLHTQFRLLQWMISREMWAEWWRVKFVVGVGDDHLYQMYKNLY